MTCWLEDPVVNSVNLSVNNEYSHIQFTWMLADIARYNHRYRLSTKRVHRRIHKTDSIILDKIKVAQSKLLANEVLSLI